MEDRDEEISKGRDGVISSLQEWANLCKKKYIVCELTGSKENLQSHHIYDKSTYPDRAFDLDNCIVLNGYYHQELFHTKFMGGKNKTTSPDDLIKWIGTLPANQVDAETKNRVFAKLERLKQKYNKIKKPDNNHKPKLKPKLKPKHHHHHHHRHQEPIECKPKKRTRNGDYVFNRSNKRYENKAKDEVHEKVRECNKSLNASRKAHKKDIRTLIKRVIIIVGVFALLFILYNSYQVKKFVLECEKCGYYYIRVSMTNKIWFERDGADWVQIEGEPICKETDLQLDRFSSYRNSF